MRRSSYLVELLMTLVERRRKVRKVQFHSFIRERKGSATTTDLVTLLSGLSGHQSESLNGLCLFRNATPTLDTGVTKPTSAMPTSDVTTLVALQQGVGECPGGVRRIKFHDPNLEIARDRLKTLTASLRINSLVRKFASDRSVPAPISESVPKVRIA